jgi:hypothetical protein
MPIAAKDPRRAFHGYHRYSFVEGLTALNV